jgi:hypothetical protein
VTLCPDSRKYRPLMWQINVVSFQSRGLGQWPGYQQSQNVLLHPVAGQLPPIMRGWPERR